MTDLQAVAPNLLGKNVAIKTNNNEQVKGTLHEIVKDDQGAITALVVRLYFHRTQVDAKDIMMVEVFN